MTKTSTSLAKVSAWTVQYAESEVPRSHLHLLSVGFAHLPLVGLVVGMIASHSNGNGGAIGRLAMIGSRGLGNFPTSKVLPR